MNGFFSSFWPAFWAEALKARRSKISWLSIAGFSLLPLAGALFMVILKDPERARALGLISMKAQLTGGSADWPTFFSILCQGAGIAGGMIFALITAWVFGREYSDRTAKEILALPAPRQSIVTAKFALILIWMLALSLFVFGLALAIGALVVIPGWSRPLAVESLATMLLVGILNYCLVPFVAFFASSGKGYLPAIGWAFLTLMLGQVAAVLGWGDWFPWSIPALASGMAGPRPEVLGVHSYGVMLAAFLISSCATLLWWLKADQ